MPVRTAQLPIEVHLELCILNWMQAYPSFDACAYTFALWRYWGLPPYGFKEFVIPLSYWELAFRGA